MVNAICRSDRFLTLFTVFLFLSSTVSTLVYANTGTSSKSTRVYDENVVHLDLNFYNDSFSSYDYSSESPVRTVKFNDNSKNKRIGYQIRNGDFEIDLKPVKIYEISNENNSNIGNPILGSVNSKVTLKRTPVSSHEITFCNSNYYDIHYENTISGVKELIVIKSPPTNLTSDLVFRTELDIDSSLNIPRKNQDPVFPLSNISGNRDLTDKKISLFDKKDRNEVFGISHPVLWDSPSTIDSDHGRIHLSNTRISPY